MKTSFYQVKNCFADSCKPILNILKTGLETVLKRQLCQCRKKWSLFESDLELIFRAGNYLEYFSPKFGSFSVSLSGSTAHKTLFWARLIFCKSQKFLKVNAMWWHQKRVKQNFYFPLHDDKALFDAVVCFASCLKILLEHS